jgi:hypothetical protein
MNKTTFYITSWDDQPFETLRADLINFGIPSESIHRIADRTSRPIAMNKAWAKCETQYIAFLDSDIKLAKNPFLPRMEYLLDNHAKIGAVVIPCYQFADLPEDVKPQLPEDTPVEKSLSNLSSNLITLNCILIRQDIKTRFEEAYFGNQVFDLDLGWSLLREGYATVADLTLALAHTPTNYLNKNLFYHAAISRNRQIMKAKWSNIDAWTNLDTYNSLNNNEIPSIEELSHSNEDKLLSYIVDWDEYGLKSCYMNPRFENIFAIAQYLAKVDATIKNRQQTFNYNIVNGFPQFI